MTTKVTKNIAAVPKSFISASMPIQPADSNRNIHRFRFIISLSSVAAPAYTNAIFAISEGCTESGPIKIQFFAPYTSLPNSRVSASRPSAPAAINQRSFTERPRSRSSQPSTMNTARPIPNAASCLYSADGSDDAMTAKPIVDRKKAMDSTSKPVLRSVRMTR